MSSIGLIILAVVPALFLMFIAYILDKQEKEPIGLLVGIFMLGVVSCIPAAIVEAILGNIAEAILGNTILYHFVFAFLIVAVAEEGFKFLFARLLTWKNKHFDYTYDGVVYCLYSSLGFAAFENILYVVEGGVGIGIARALLSVPMHAVFGIVMGTFYSKAKGCSYAGNASGVTSNTFKALLFPVILHGTYDFCLFTENGLLIILDLVFTVVMLITTFGNLKKAAKNDAAYVVPEPASAPISPVAPVAPAAPAAAPVMYFPTTTLDNRLVKWTCSCGNSNNTKFCPACGKARADFVWNCSCGKVCGGKFCGKCGSARP